MIMTAAQWIVLDNLTCGWAYWTNLDRKLADEAYRQCEEKGWIKDNQATGVGETVLFLVRGIRGRMLKGSS